MIRLRLAFFTLAIVLLTSAKTDEGMFPLSELSKLDLKKAGLRIPFQQLYNPSGPSIMDAIVRVGGCTGSFISPDGLIITNHHCAFSFVANISDSVNDYIRNGFLAKDRTEERLAAGLVCKITSSYEDVSARVLESSKSETDPLKRKKLIEESVESILETERKKYPDLQSEISEMFIGRTYVLFRYKLLKDVRLVYVPPRSIGEYGGESDNWVWPRHSGDFAILRAYVDKDGKAAAYSKDNVPYKPVQHLKINPKGVNENDFIFILGYPGRTFRHYPAGFFEYHQNYMLPFISSLYDFQIKTMEEAGKNSRSKQIYFSSKIKSLANVTKNYKGKLQGFKRTKLAEAKRAEEKELFKYITSDRELNFLYGDVLPRIDTIYAGIFRDAPLNLWIDNIYGASGLINAASFIAKYDKYMKVLTKEEQKEFLKSKGNELKNGFSRSYNYFDIEVDKIVLKKMLVDMFKINDSRLDPIKAKIKVKNGNIEKSVNDWVDKALAKSKLKDATNCLKLLKESPEKVFTIKEPLVELASVINEVFIAQDEVDTKRDADLKLLMSKYVEVKQRWKQASFIPDANATLRFTYGYVRGYRPQDGEYHKPFTTIKGILEKEDEEEYALLDIIKELYHSKAWGSYAHPQLGEVPVDFLYNLDTTGGNSGSPVLDADGQLIGVNFDRAFTATINDYAWNENYSRSVGVDIRYVLWVLQKVARADHVLKEIGQ
jgi:hypothetical protein